tara:strand:+ start:199 stop:468 length:270 start_codon:yes stop_codon:yes gene_type:complete
VSIQWVVVIFICSVLLVGFLIAAIQILRDVFIGYGMTLTELRKLQMLEMTRKEKLKTFMQNRPYKIINLNKKKDDWIREGDINEWWDNE